MIKVDQFNTLGDLWRVIRHLSTVLFYMAVGGLIALLLYPINDTSLNDKAIELNVNCSFTGSQVSGLVLPSTGIK